MDIFPTKIFSYIHNYSNKSNLILLYTAPHTARCVNSVLENHYVAMKWSRSFQVSSTGDGREAQKARNSGASHRSGTDSFFAYSKY